jgi:hypothetical protein
VQSGAHPSFGSVLPSSHASRRSTTTPSPQIAGAPRWIASGVIRPKTMRTEPAPEETIDPAASPSTRATKSLPAALGSKRTTRLSPVVARERAGSGRRIGPNAGTGARPLFVNAPEIES